MKDLLYADAIMKRMKARRQQEYDWKNLDKMKYDIIKFQRVFLDGLLLRMLNRNEELPKKATEILVETGNFWLVDRLFEGRKNRIKCEFAASDLERALQIKLRNNDRNYKQAMDAARKHEL